MGSVRALFETGVRRLGVAGGVRAEPARASARPGATEDGFDGAAPLSASDPRVAAQQARLDRALDKLSTSQAWTPQRFFAKRELRAVLRSWGVHPAAPPVLESVRLASGARGTKVTAQFEHQGQRFALWTNPALGGGAKLLSADLKLIPLPEFIRVGALGKARIPTEDARFERPSMTAVISRIGGHDGVSLEHMNWAEMMQQRGFPVHFVTGQVTDSEKLTELKRGVPPVKVTLLKDADPADAANQEIRTSLFGAQADAKALLGKLEPRTALLKGQLEKVLRRSPPDFLITENESLPWDHFAFSVAAQRLESELGLAVVARSHDFPQDRPAYAYGALPKATASFMSRFYRDFARPGRSNVAINTRDVEKYFSRYVFGRPLKNAEVTVIYNAVKTSDPRIARQLSKQDEQRLREGILGPGHANDFVAVCPVRPVDRKRLDVAVELLRRVKQRSPQLGLSMLVTHDTVDGKPEELSALRRAAAEAGINLVFAHEPLQRLNAGRPQAEKFDAFDLYKISNLGLYYSDFEGFGNALLEVLAMKRMPVLVNRYEIYKRDIEPTGIRNSGIDLPAEFTFQDWMKQGPASFQDPRWAASLGAQLDGQAELVSRMFQEQKDPKAPPPARFRQEAEHNFAIVHENFGFEAIWKQLESSIFRAFAASNAR